MTVSFAFPEIAYQGNIPKNIYVTYPTEALPSALEENIASLKLRNPEWTFTLFTDDDQRPFILKHYGEKFLTIFDMLDSSYGASRADLFRYFVMYVLGGVYLDIKSNTSVPLNDSINGDEEFILSNWDNEPTDKHAGFGIFKDLSGFDCGEFQQWHIICRPGHPFLKAVIERVAENIQQYSPWTFGTGHFGGLRVTGPIPYTLAIEPIRSQYKHRYVRKHLEIGLVYNNLSVDHRSFYKTHYSVNTRPMVAARGARRLLDEAYVLGKKLKKAFRSQPRKAGSV